MKPFLFILLVSLIGCGSSNSQSQSTNSQGQLKEPDFTKVNEYINIFFKKYKDFGSSNAIDYLFSTNKQLANTPQVVNLKNKLDSTRLIIGKYYGRALITQKNVSPDLVLLTYLVKYDMQPIRFSFIFYKPNEDWILYKFQYDDQTISELEDSGKIYFIK